MPTYDTNGNIYRIRGYVFALRDVCFGTHPNKRIPCGYYLTMVRAKR